MKMQRSLIFIIIMNVVMTGISYGIPPLSTINKYFYVSAMLGSHILFDGNTEIPSIFAKPPLTSEPIYHAGYLTGISVGYRDNPFRFEGEFAYRNAPMVKINDAIGQGTVTNVTDSYTRLTSIFLNGYYDVNFLHRIASYIGLGGGYVRVNNDINPDPAIPVGPGIFFTNKRLNYNTWGYQGIVGVLYQLPKNIQQDIQLGVEYRYFATLSQHVTGRTNLGPDGYQTQQKISDQTIALVMQYYFA